jgi:hypothetical protein
MTTRRHASVIAAIAVASVAIAGCSSPGRMFHSRPKPTAIDKEAQRISLLELSDQLKVSDTLKGQDFFLPPPQPQADWPLPGGTLEQSVENVDAAPDFQIAWRKPFGGKSTHREHVMAPACRPTTRAPAIRSGK